MRILNDLMYHHVLNLPVINFLVIKNETSTIGVQVLKILEIQGKNLSEIRDIKLLKVIFVNFMTSFATINLTKLVGFPK